MKCRAMDGRKPCRRTWEVWGVSFIISMLPGIIGALCAYISLKVMLFVGVGSVEAEIVVFFLVYIAATALAEKAMVRYGSPSG